MNNQEEISCSLCLATLRDRNCVMIEDAIELFSNGLLLKLNLDRHSLVCKLCLQKITDFSVFKTNYVHINNKMNESFNSKNKLQMSLKEIYMIEKNDKGTEMLYDKEKVCRFCLGRQTNAFKQLHGAEEDIVFVRDSIHKYLPEVNLNQSQDPVACDHCYRPLKSFFDFIKNCLHVVENKKERLESEIVGKNMSLLERDCPASFKVANCDEIVQVKQELCESDGLTNEGIKGDKTDWNVNFEMDKDMRTNKFIPGGISFVSVKNEEKTEAEESAIFLSSRPTEMVAGHCKTINEAHHKQQNTAKESLHKMFTCKLCDHKTNLKSSLKKHMLIHSYLPENLLYKCGLCDFKTKRKYCLNRHSSMHEDPSQKKTFTCLLCGVTMKWERNLKAHMLKHNGQGPKTKLYKCNSCDFETRYNSSLTTHKLTHLGPAERQVYECGLCNFKSKRKYWLNQHRLAHEDPSRVKVYSCDVCGHSTSQKGALISHMLMHKNRTEIETHKCDKCRFETPHTSNLKRHMLTHLDPSQRQVYKCDACDFKTVAKFDMKRHKPIHDDPTQIEMLACDVCAFKTKWERSLNTHMLSHKDASEIRMYACNVCNYKTRRCSALKRHMSVHLDPSERHKYSCHSCDFKTASKFDLKRHKSVHDDGSQINILKCDVCKFSTTWKNTLKNHMLSHTEILEVNLQV